MSEFWVSRKKWTCKYCDVTINDDVPSRQQHENGLRHKGNVERQLRQAYKKSEKDRKEERDAKREMEKIEKLAHLSHAKDLAEGSKTGSLASPSTSETTDTTKTIDKEAKSSKGVTAWKPTNRLAAYGSALPFDVGNSADEEEKTLKEWQERQEARRKEGTAGEWETVTPVSSVVKSSEAEAPPIPLRREAASYVVREKQGHFRQEDEDDAAREIKVKKRIRVQSEAEKIRQAEEDKKQMIPTWKPMRLDTGVGVKQEGVQTVPVEKRETQQIDLTGEDANQSISTEEAKSIEGPPQEEEEEEGEEASTFMFKKRKSGAGAGAKRVRAVI